MVATPWPRVVCFAGRGRDARVSTSNPQTGSRGEAALHSEIRQKKKRIGPVGLSLVCPSASWLALVGKDIERSMEG